MKMSIIQHKLTNFNLNSKSLNQIQQDETNQMSIIHSKIQLIFDYYLNSIDT